MIEISDGKSRYQYRICPTHANFIEQRKNKRGERWKLYRHVAHAADARQVLLRLQLRERNQP